MHARRYFHDATQADPARLCLALALIQQLYQVEKAAKDMTVLQCCAYCQEHVVPILDRFGEWMKL